MSTKRERERLFSQYRSKKLESDDETDLEDESWEPPVKALQKYPSAECEKLDVKRKKCAIHTDEELAKDENSGERVAMLARCGAKREFEAQ